MAGPPSFSAVQKRFSTSLDLGRWPRSFVVGGKSISCRYRGPQTYVQTVVLTFVEAIPSSFDGAYSMPGDIEPVSFKFEPLFTMKRLDEYPHAPNEELLGPLVKSHYEGLVAIIHPELRKQMDPESLKIFSEIAYKCLDDKRQQRPNIDQILIQLEKALEVQKSVALDAIGEVKETSSDRWKGTPSERLQIPLEDMQKALESGSQKFLGEGTYGKVYSGELELPFKEKATGRILKRKSTVAIKCITDPQRGKKGFDAEIKLLTSCKHPNVVSLLGFCEEGSEMKLVYEIASNGSLDDYLVKTDNLPWKRRIQIAIDIACGLEYLHTRVDDTQENIVHRDIKSGNILLGNNLEAKIADFGLSRFHQAKSVKTIHIAGTNFYLCPEYEKTGRLTTKVDIYSFGVVLFEILSGKLANNEIYLKGIAEVANLRFKDGTLNEMVDPKIMEEVDELTSALHRGPNKDSLKVYLDIACQCIKEDQDGCPTIKKIVDELKKALLYQEKNKDGLQMSFKEIKEATLGFSDDNRIGSGGFGNVYEGKVTRGVESTKIVAKRCHAKRHANRRQGEEQFFMELEILSDYKHENIIGLEGYCNEKLEKIIVYEHASNGSLDKHLGNVSLTWAKRLEICIDIASGLAFLHGGAGLEEMVVHRDIKSANILLKADWKAKISDFGLSAIIATNQEVRDSLVGTIGYIDPLYKITHFFSEKSDIYSLGVVLFEILHGQLLTGIKLDEARAISILKKINEMDIVFEGIKEQIAPLSLSSFRLIVSRCLVMNDSTKRPTAQEVLEELQKSLKLQKDYEDWGPKLPVDYDDILKQSTCSGTYSSKMKKELYDLLSEGVLLRDDKLLFTLGRNSERYEMISASTFSYRNGSPHDNWCIKFPKSRFKMVAEMLDISNLMIKIETRAQFLSPNTVYGVYLVFKFSDSGNVSRTPMYVDLKYRKGNETLHAYFAKRRDDEWMMIEFYHLNPKDDGYLEVLIESLSSYYSREHDAIYVEGIEFRPIANVEHVETISKSREIQRLVLESNANSDQVLQMPTKRERILKGSINYDYGEELFSVTEVNGKKHLMVSATVAFNNFSDLKLFKSNPSPGSRFKEVLEFLPQQMFRINCMIKSQMLSRDAEYMCYLVFKLSKTCHELYGPIEVRDLLQKYKVSECVYFRTPSPWNTHDITRVPKQRKDGWMEVDVWKFNSNHELVNDCVHVNLKFVSYEDSLSGLIVCGLEFRPM